MLKFLLIITACITLHTTNAVGQKRANDISLGLNAGWTGQSSPEVIYIQAVIKAGYKDELLSLLNSDNVKLQFLAVVTIDNALKKQELEVTNEQLNFINSFKKKRGRIYIQSGCTVHLHGSIRKTFRKSNYPIRNMLDNYLRRNES